MMKNKKLGLLAIVLIAMTAMMFSVSALTGCGESEKPPESATVASISLDTADAAKTFTVGDTFTAEGVKVTVKMSDNTSKDVALTECTVSEPDMMTAGKKTVTVTYSGKSNTYEITVNAPEQVVTYNVTFNTMGGSEVAPVTTDGKTVAMPSAPTKDKYAFDGWYYNKAHTEAFDQSALAASPITSDITLWAKWEQTAEVTYVFEAEDAALNAKTNIEKPAGDRASGGKSLSFLHAENNVTKLTFGLYSEKATEATLGTVVNKVDPANFEAVFALAVNGNQITIGDVEGNGWDGTSDGANFDFRRSIDKTVNLVAGENTIEYTVVDKSKSFSNFDCIKVTTADSIVRWVDGESNLFEAEDAALPEGAMIEENIVQASGGKSVGGLVTVGQTMTFNITSDSAAKAVLGIDMNHRDPFTFEDKLKLTVNGEQVTVGEVLYSYWGSNGDVENLHYIFGYPFWVDIELIKGENVVEFTVDGDGPHGGGWTNFDCIYLKTVADVDWTSSAE